MKPPPPHTHTKNTRTRTQADKADLAAWEVRSAEERSKGLFFKSLYAVEKEKRQPVGKSIPGYYRVSEQRLAGRGEGREGREGSEGRGVGVGVERVGARSVTSAWLLGEYNISYIRVSS